MTRKAPAPLLWVVLTTLPLVSLAASINDAFNAGKAFGSEASATMAGPTMAAEDVPGFTTATPAEVQLYGNAAGLEDAAATAASNNEAAQSVTEGFVERPYFTIAHIHVAGDVTLDYALDHIARTHPEAKSVAEALLARLGGTP